MCIENFKELLLLQKMAMQRALIYLFAGTGISFLINHFFYESKGWETDSYSSFAFGLGWAMAYFVDHPEWPLSKKLGFSFIGMSIIAVAGIVLFDVEVMVPALMRFSLIFVAYYLLASFRAGKTLRK